jgi:uncharacterized oxidoreductase
MKLTGNTILITGGGSGIGLAMAERFQTLGNQVLVAGRNPDKLKNAAAKGMTVYTVDMTDAKSIAELAGQVTKQHPGLNAVIHNAGIMRNENLLAADAATREETIATNLLGPMRLTDALLPHLKNAKDPVIMTVSSGLAFLPLAMTPTYCATKAAIHSYSLSLRYQLRETGIRVIELAPPYVQTGLMGERQKNDPAAMPLKEFIEEVFTLLKTQPDADEILVERVKLLRDSGEKGRAAQAAFFKQFNDHMIAARAGEL